MSTESEMKENINEKYNETNSFADCELRNARTYNNDIMKETHEEEMDVFIKIEKRVQLILYALHEGMITVGIIKKLLHEWTSNWSVSSAIILNPE